MSVFCFDFLCSPRDCKAKTDLSMNNKQKKVENEAQGKENV